MHGQASLAVVVLACAAGLARGAPAGFLVDDFVKPEPAGWQISGSPDYHQGGFGAAGLAIVPAAVDGLPALRAPIRIAADAKTPAVWLTRTLAAVPSAAPRGLVGLFATLALVEAGSLTLKYIG